MTFNDLLSDNGLFCDGDWIEKKDQDVNGLVRLIQLADIGICEFKDKSNKYITEQTAQNLNCTYLKKGDILIARLPEPLGRACIFPYDGKFITAVDVAILRPANDKVNNQYIMYLINSPQFRKQIKKFESGTTRKRISRKNLDRIVFKIPDYQDQHRIVTRIEELFSQLDSGVETLKKTKEQLKVYRQAVLNELICEGELSELRYCIDDMGQGWSPKCIRTPVLNNDEWAVITTTSIQPMKFIYSENKKLPDSLEPRMKHVIEVGDILITRAGPRVRCGVCCMVRQTKSKLLNCDKVYRIKVNKRLIIPEYLEIVLNSPEFQKEVSFCKTGGNDSGVNLTQERFLSIKIPVPTINKQKEKVEEAESRLSVCDSIEKTIDTALQEAEALRQSILKQAFEGGL